MGLALHANRYQQKVPLAKLTLRKSLLAAGEDPLVMHGMKAMLADHRVDVLEFEFNRKWKTTLRQVRPLEPVINWLQQLGYTCFWQGNRGTLAQLTAPCYVEETRNRFGFPRSNAVCSYREDIIKVFRTCQRVPYCKEA